MQLRRVLLHPASCDAECFSRGDETRRNDRLRVYARDRPALAMVRAAAGEFVTFPPPTGAPGIREPQALQRELEAVGFENAREIEEVTELSFGSIDEWWASLWTHGSR